MKWHRSVLFIMSAAAFAQQPQAKRDLQPERLEDVKPERVAARSYAVVIGISHYQNLPPTSQFELSRTRCLVHLQRPDQPGRREFQG